MARERYQSLSREEKEKSGNMVLSDTKISQKMKEITCLTIEKTMIK